MTKDIREKPLADVVKGMKPERVRMMLAKDAFITIRVTQVDKDQMKQTAKALHLTMTEYITQMHYLIAERLGQRAKARSK